VTNIRRVLLAALCCSALAACAMVDDEPTVSADAGQRQAVSSADVSRNFSNGAVEVFSLDAPAGGAMPASAAPGGMASTDPSVTVFPLDGAMPGAPMPPPQSGGAMPLLLPGGDVGRSALPSSPRLTGPDDMSSYSAPSYSAPADYGAAGYGAGDYNSGYDSSPENKIYFSYGSSAINRAGRDVIGAYAGRYQGAPGGVLRVDGHASPSASVQDPVERQIVNLKVSMDRAFNVSRALIRKGVPAAAIETRAYGDTQPAPAGPHGDSEASSRRVEISSAP
jgi:outer membrane protein OmpA-like peptidoglycan-associated protein